MTHGRVQVPGFYDDVLELTDDERELFARVPADDAEFLTVAKSRALAGEQGFTTLERIGARPTAEVNGIWGGYMGAGGKTIVPSDAHVKLSFRLVAAQEPARIRAAVDAFVAAHTPAGISATVGWEGDGVEPCLVPLGTPAYDALTRAISAAFDGRPCCRRARAAAVPRQRSSVSARRWCSSASACPTTRSTRRTRRSPCRCSTAAPRRPACCGASSPIWAGPGLRRLTRAAAPRPGPCRACDRRPTVTSCPSAFLTSPRLVHPTLGNGLRVVLAPDRSAPVVGVAVLYDVGIRSEPEGRTGFAHLFEHLMFQGSANLEKLEHFRYVQASGGVFNGSTHFDYTNYFEVLPSNALERGLFLEADRMRVAAPDRREPGQPDRRGQGRDPGQRAQPALRRFPWLELPRVLFDTFANSHNGYGSFVDLESATVQDAADFFAPVLRAGQRGAGRGR